MTLSETAKDVGLQPSDLITGEWFTEPQDIIEDLKALNKRCLEGLGVETIIIRYRDIVFFLKRRGCPIKTIREILQNYGCPPKQIIELTGGE